MPNPISKKLLLSKWTASKPKQKEKHFLVSKIYDPDLDTANTVPKDFVELEAIMSKRKYLVPIEDLKNQDQWVIGWKH
ncbi:Conserved hypothetical protein CHP02450, tryptophan-rich [Burkholderiaceae bacterium]|jgi:tryptophan-rich hypothetical protein